MTAAFVLALVAAVVLLVLLTQATGEEHRLKDEVARLTDHLAREQERTDYWRGRAERIIDAALVRAGAIHEPTMVDRKPPPQSPAALFATAMGITEIDGQEPRSAPHQES